MACVYASSLRVWRADAHTGEFILNQLTTLLLLAWSIMKALKPPKFYVDYRAWLKKRHEFPESMFSMKTEFALLMQPAGLVVESEAVRFLHLEKVDAGRSLGPTAALGIAAAAQVMPA